MNHQELRSLVPHVALNNRRRVGTFRVFQTGSVVQVGRWPYCMDLARGRFVAQMDTIRLRVIEGRGMRQRTLSRVGVSGNGDAIRASDEYLTHRRASVNKDHGDVDPR